MEDETPIRAVTFTDEKGKKVDSFAVKFKEFSTGSRGYYGGGKIIVDNKSYQVSCNIVEIGSKPHTNGHDHASRKGYGVA